MCSVLTEKLENNLNANGNVTLDTKLAQVDAKIHVDYIVKKYYKMIGFKGSPYRMRNFRSQTLKLIETKHNDHELKEYLCGHKVQAMSFIYDTSMGLSETKEKEWREKYACVDSWISEMIFSAQTKRVLDMGKAITDFAVTLGISQEQANKIYEIFEQGKMTLEQLRERLRTVTMKTHEE